MWAYGWRQAAGVKPRSPKGRAEARGLDACCSLQHAFMRARDASLKKQAHQNNLDSDHGIYRDLYCLTSESIDHHDSEDHGWREHRLKRRLSFGHIRFGM
jgi:hypothetical protein